VIPNIVVPLVVVADSLRIDFDDDLHQELLDELREGAGIHLGSEDKLDSLAIQ